VIRIAVKPTPSIAKPQQTIDLHGTEAEKRIRGRHDPCTAPRVIPVAEEVLALVLIDAVLEQAKYRP
jgi:chorismate synthase